MFAFMLTIVKQDLRTPDDIGDSA